MDAVAGGGLTRQDWFVIFNNSSEETDNFMTFSHLFFLSIFYWGLKPAIAAGRGFFIVPWKMRWPQETTVRPLSSAAELRLLFLGRVYKTFRTKGDLLNGKPNETWQARHLAFCTAKRHSGNTVPIFSLLDTGAVFSHYNVNAISVIRSMAWSPPSGRRRRSCCSMKPINSKWLI